jgi:uncharacterized membrane protein YeaQ/YmgE (transglycosylase-associated protein family)
MDLNRNVALIRINREVVHNLFYTLIEGVKSMHITIQNLLVWLIISLIVGFLGELIARRRAPEGIIGATILGFIAIFLIVGVFGIHFAGDPEIAGVPLFTSILVAALLVALWSAFAYRRIYHPYRERYYRRGTYARRPRRRRSLFR